MWLGERLVLPPCTPDFLRALVLDKCWQTLPQHRANMQLVRQALADAVCRCCLCLHFAIRRVDDRSRANMHARTTTVGRSGCDGEHSATAGVIG
jgi:hypothetical protein